MDKKLNKVSPETSEPSPRHIILLFVALEYRKDWQK